MAEGTENTLKSNEQFLFRGAHTVILVISSHDVNAAIAASNMELMAEALGIGAMYAGDFTWIANKSEEIRKLLNLKEDQEIKVSLALGYPDVRFFRTVPRKTPTVQWM